MTKTTITFGRGSFTSDEKTVNKQFDPTVYCRNVLTVKRNTLCDHDHNDVYEEVWFHDAQYWINGRKVEADEFFAAVKRTGLDWGQMLKLVEEKRAAVYADMRAFGYYGD